MDASKTELPQSARRMLGVLAMACAVLAGAGCGGGGYGSGGSGGSMNTSGPTITSEPQSVTASVGKTASFSVMASGYGMLVYQWTRDGTNISGALESSYTTGTLSLTDNGAMFAVQVTDGYGVSRTSSPAMLTVQ